MAMPALPIIAQRQQAANSRPLIAMTTTTAPMMCAMAELAKTIRLPIAVKMLLIAMTTMPALRMRVQTINAQTLPSIATTTMPALPMAAILLPDALLH